MLGLLYALLVLLNVGGIANLLFSFSQGFGVWMPNLAMLLALDLFGFYLLRVLREDG